jgi:hypothetical protein
VTIPNSVTSIGNDAFYNCTGLTSVTIPNTVTSIGKYAFDGCTGLTSVTIGNSVTSIDYRTFYGCTKLTSITIPNSVTSIGNEAFYGCTGLTSVTMGNTVTSIGQYAFRGCTGLTSVTIPNSVTSIGDEVFSGCTGLTSVTIGNSVTSINYRTFYGCTKLTSITIPNSVTSIGNSAFSGCTGLTSVTIPNSVTTIGSGAFYRCAGLTSVTIPNSIIAIGDDTFSGCTGLISVIIPNSVIAIGEDAFNGCTGLTSVTIGNSVISIGKTAFHTCTGLISVTIPNSVTSIGDGAFTGCTGLKHITALPTTPPTIGENTFYCCSAHLLATSEDYKTADYWKNFTNIRIDANVSDEIAGGDVVSRELIEGIYYDIDGYDAFVVGCADSVTNLNIPSEITYNSHTYPVFSIGDCAFSDCTGLTSVTIPSSVTEIGVWAFWGCSGLNKVNITDVAAWCGIPFDDFSNPLSYAGHLYLNDQEITDLVIPNTVTSIGDFAFEGCIGLSSVTIPNSVTSIGQYAFWGCTGLTSVVIPDSVTIIGEAAFAWCTGLTSVTIGNSVTTIGDNAFAQCKSMQNFSVASDNAYYATDSVGALFNKDFTTLVICPGGKTELDIPQTVTSIGNSAFFYCEGLTSVTIPNSVTSIGDYAFSGCSGLKHIIALPTTPPTIAEYTFSDYSVPLIATSEAYKTADYWKNFKNITIDANAGDVYVGGEVVSKVLIDDIYYDIDGINASVVGCVDSVTDLNIPSEITYNGRTYPVTSIGEEACINCTGLTSVVIPNSVTLIGDSAFWGCSGITSVIIPNSVTEIEYYAFRGCTSLQKFIVESDNTAFASDEQGAIYNKDFTTLIICPDGKTEFDIPQTVTSIGELAFWGCSGLTSVTIPDSVTSIGQYAFSRCTGLKSVTIPNSVTLIGSGAFYACSGLTSVTIPNSVTSIGTYAFYYCTGLKRIIALPTTPPTIEEDTFSDYSVPLVATSEAYKTADYWKNFTNITIDANAGDVYAGGEVVSKVLIDDIYYDIDGIDASVVGCVDSVTAINIPSEITYNGHTYPVTSIGKDSFWGRSGLTSVTIPNSVTLIGSGAFYNCSGLTSVTIPDSVTSIGYQTFAYCYGLNSVIISNSVTSIGYYAFYECNKLTTVTIPDSVTSIGDYAFKHCTGLRQITALPATPPTIEEDTFSDYSVPLVATSEAYRTADYWKNFTNITIDANAGDENAGGDVVSNVMIGDIYYDIDGSVATVVGCANSVKVLNIPDEITYNGHTYPVTSIGEEAFIGRAGLTSATMGNSVSSIGICAFFYCTGLTTVVIPDSVTEIGDSAFGSCTALNSVTIPGSVTTIGNHVFSGCIGLTSVTIPDAVTEIGVQAFANCTGLTTVTIGNSVTEIDWYAFDGCTGLTSVTIPTSVTKIEKYAFSGCAGITELKFEDGEGVLTLGDDAFKDVTPAEAYFGRQMDFTAVPVSALETVEFGETVTDIADGAFKNATSLRTVTSRNTVPPTTDDTFSDDTYLDGTLYVPTPSIDAYKAADGWKNFLTVETFVVSDGIREIGVDCNAPFRVEAGAICVSGDTDVRIVSLNGTTIYNGRGETRINLVRGIYVVIVNNTATKVAVK